MTELYDKVHRAIAQRNGKWPQQATHVLDMADMLVGYCSNSACKRALVEGRRESGSKIWKGSWKYTPYAAGINRAFKLLGMRRGLKGHIRLPPNWKERLGEAGIDWATMDVIKGQEMKWARAWRQFMEYESFRIDRQRAWNALGEPAAWPPPVIGWEARTNSKVMRGIAKAKELVEEQRETPKAAFDVTKGFRKRVSMRLEEG